MDTGSTNLRVPAAPPPALLPGAGDYDASVYEWFEIQADRTPDATALVCGPAALTYGELRDWSRGIAARLYDPVTAGSEVVGVCFDKSPAAYASILGVLGAHAGYLPVDPLWPDAFIDSILHEAGCARVVTDESQAIRLRALGFECVCVDGTERAAGPLPLPSPDGLSYVLCTSGSTGRPKATCFDHRALTRVASWQMERSGCVPGMRTAQFSVLSFDVSLQEMFSTWSSGGVLVVVPPAIRADAPALLEFLRAERIDRLFIPIAVLTAMAQAAAETPIDGLALREVICGGDTMLLPEQLVAFFRRLPGCTLDNQYGPTETHGVTAFRLAGDPSTWPSRPPIGMPVGRAQVYLLDDDLVPVAEGEEGEIYVSGPGLAREYIGRPELTRERFLPCPFAGEPGARMYRTGDMARRVNGVLEFHGRRDLQVKIRGYRVEPAEVENVIKRHPAIVDAAVIAVAAPDGARRLAAFYVATTDLRAEDVRQFVAGSLPSFAVPSSCTCLPSLPLNANGKVDRRRLQTEVQADLASVQTAVVESLQGREQALAGIWSAVFGTDRIDRSSSFFELGGNSLSAARIVRLIASRLGLRISMAALFQSPTLGDLAAALQSAEQTSVAVVDERDGRARAADEPFPLTDVQLVYTAARSGAVSTPSRAAHVYVEYDAERPDLERVERAVRALVGRHDALRTLAREDGQQQAMGDAAGWRLEVHDLRGGDAEERGERLRSLRALLGHTPRSLDRWPPFDLVACRLSDERVRFLIRFDLLAGDLRSMQILVREFERLYRGADPGRPGRPFREFVERERATRDSAAFAAASKYWLDRVGDFPDAPSLPLRARAFDLRDGEFTRRSSQLRSEETARFEAQARAHGVTLSAAVLAAYAAVLATWSSEPRFTITLPILDREEEGWDDTVGDFSSVLPVVVDTAEGGGFAGLAQAVQRQLLQDLQHRHFSTIDLLRRLASRGGGAPRSPLGVVFTSTLNANLSGFEAAVPGWHEGVHYSIAHTPQVWLDLQVGHVDGRLRYNFDSVDAMFEAGTPAAVAGAFQRLLAWLSAENADWSAPLPCLTPDADLALCDRTNGAAKERPVETLHGLFLTRAAQQPDAVAVIWSPPSPGFGETSPSSPGFGGTSPPSPRFGATSAGQLTYGQLRAHARTVRRQLEDRGVGAGCRVGIALDKGWQQLAAVLGVQMLGAAYVPVDVSWPPARIHEILRRARVACVLTGGDPPQGSPADLRWPADLPACAMDERPDASANLDPIDVSDRSVAYVIYTSGSTGTPKGVAIDHRGAVNTILDVNERWHVAPGDRVLALSSLAFDLSVYDIFGTLAAGGAIVLPDADKLRDPVHWSRLVARHGVTVWNSVPALMDMLVTSAEGDARPSLEGLRLVMLSGDWIPKPLYPRIRALCPKARVVALGGATEASIWSICHEITGDTIDDAPTESVPYGRPLTNQAMYVCDEAVRLRPVGVAGELYIGGRGVALEYLGDAEKTAAQFVDHPAWGRLFRTGDYGRCLRNGEIEFLGRRDAQVKINGYRIGLAEIEAALAACPGVDAAAALVVGRESGAPRIVAFAATRRPSGQSAYLAALREQLPSYMVPAEVRELEQLPLTGNGKCDQERLRQLCAEGQALPARKVAGHDAEARVASVFARLLGGRQPDVTRNLFELGINSLHLVRAFNELREALPQDFTVTQMFAYPTVRELASLVDAEPVAPEQAPLAAHDARSRARGPYERDVAVVGLSARFPGARNVEEFWRNLAGGVESIRPLTDAELRASGAARFKDDPSFVPAGALVEDVEWFDAAFFGMDPREAELCDPQHRVFLECAWEALEQAGCDPAATTGRVGVFAGTNMSTYLLSNLDPGMAKTLDGLPGLIGNDKDYVATRVSYRLNLRGPSVTVQTACSTSLVAVHMACQSLVSGECDLALAGGVTINVPQATGYRYQEDGPVSPDGHCRAFDAKGQGTVLGNGVGIVALKRLSDALADGDRIDAVIKGSAINNDGSAKVGFTAPSARGQADVIAQALAVAGVDAGTIGYVEAHGTGTALGDPIEVSALTRVFARQTNRRQYCALGSVKTNVGHLDSAAGVAGLIKTVLCLRHRQLVPSLHFEEPNPAIDFAASPFCVNTTLRAWDVPAGARRRAGVSSFGIGGTNAHVVLEEAPEVEVAAARPAAGAHSSGVAMSHAQAALGQAAASPGAGARPEEEVSASNAGAATVHRAVESTPHRGEPAWLLPLSTRSAEALEAQRRQWDAYLAGTQEPLADIAYTAACRRSHHSHRVAVVGSDRDAWREALAQATGRVAENTPRICWVFAGQGPQSGAMGAELWREEPVFREAVTAATRALAAAGWTRAIGRRSSAAAHARQLPPGERSVRIPSDGEPSYAHTESSAAIASTRLFAQPLTDEEQDSPEIVQPALFALQWGLAALWRSWGIVPAAVVGHSLGEVAAACVAEILTLEEGARVVVERSRLLATRQGQGAMVAVALGAEEVERRLAQGAAESAADSSSAGQDSVRALGALDGHGADAARERSRAGARLDTSVEHSAASRAVGADVRQPTPDGRPPMTDGQPPIADGPRPTPDAHASAALRRDTKGLAIAAANSPTSCVVAGERAAVEAWIPALDAAGVRYHRLRTSGVAGHSPCVAGLDDALAARLADLRPRRGTVRYFSTVEGREIDGAALGDAAPGDAAPGGAALNGTVLDARYWGRNLREPVRFADAIAQALASGLTTFLELSAHPVLTFAVNECAGERRVTTIASIKRDERERPALLESAGRLWEAGAPLDWTALYGPRGRVVRLPGYPWQRRRFWIDKAPAAASGDRIPGMPLFAKRLSSPALDRTAVYEGQLDARSLPVLSQHRIHGQIVVPGALLFELLLEAAFTRCAQGRPVLRDVVLHAPLILDDITAADVQAIVSDGEDGTSTVKIYGRQAGARNGGDAWTLHASAAAIEASGVPPDLTTESWRQIRTAPRVEVDAAAMYRTVEKRGVDYGPDFRNVVQAWRGQADALAKVHGSASSEWRLDPVLLDGCLQAVGAALDEETQLYVPAGCETIRYFAPFAATMWSYVVMRGEPKAPNVQLPTPNSQFPTCCAAGAPRLVCQLGVGSSELGVGSWELGVGRADRLRADVHIISEDGKVAAELLGVQFAPADTSGYWASPRAIERAICDVQWVRDDRPRSVPSAAAGTVLVAGQGSTADAVGRALGERGVRVALVARGRRFRARLSRELRHAKQGGPVHVISVLALHEGEIEARCREALDVLQTVAEQADETTGRCWFVTRGAWPVGENEGADVAQSAVWGLVRTAALEHPHLAPSLVDLDPRDEAASIARLVDIWREGDRCEQLAVRGGQIYSPRLTQAELPPPMRRDVFTGDGSFLITGAFGGLGARVAKWMAQHGAKRLVMAGRRLTAQAESCVAALRAKGVDVAAVAVDVSNEQDVRAFVDGIPAAFRPLRGVFHLALELADASLLNQSADTLRRPILSKAQAAWNLHRATERLPIEHFVLFSSVLSVLGGAGQANYTAACAAVDALALHRRAQGLPALAIGWGPWEFADSAGLAAVHRAQQPFSAMFPMPEEAGFRILEALLTSTRSIVAVAALDRREWKRVYGRSSPILDRLESMSAAAAEPNRWRSAVRAAPPERRADAIEQYLAAEIGARVRKSADQLSLDQPLASYAIDSLAMLEVRTHISDDLGIVAAPAMFLEHPTIRLLARALAARMAAREEAVELERLSRTLDRIDDLSEEEVEATLATLERGPTL